jgi:2-polyprenyl-3-methyl-5-hydroxy-6-metoxy-1,4-benzoquinol methylase
MARLFQRAKVKVMTALGKQTGFVDECDRFRISGWAHGEEGPSAVEVEINGRRVATVEACLFRPDLAAAGIGDGRAAFVFDPSAYLTDPSNTLVVRFAGTDSELANGRHVLAFGGFGKPAAAQAAPGDGQNPWNKEQAADFSHAWNGAPACQRYVNACISGDPEVGWLEHLFRTRMAAALGRVEGARARSDYRCLILGSNEGNVERALCAAGFIGPIVASDIAEKALARAAAKAKETGYSNIRHVRADLNVDDLSALDRGGPFDFIIAEGVLHHVEKIDRCLDLLHAALAPGGALAMVEYEGPVRFQMSALQTRWINAVLAALPRELRPLPKGSEGRWPPSAKEIAAVYFAPPPADQVAQFDPTEALSGLRLKERLPQVFEIAERKGFGGTLLQYIPDHFDFRRAGHDPFAVRWLQHLIDAEKALLETGILEHENWFTVATKRADRAGGPA